MQAAIPTELNLSLRFTIEVKVIFSPIQSQIDRSFRERRFQILILFAEKLVAVSSVQRKVALLD